MRIECGGRQPGHFTDSSVSLATIEPKESASAGRVGGCAGDRAYGPKRCRAKRNFRHRLAPRGRASHGCASEFFEVRLSILQVSWHQLIGLRVYALGATTTRAKRSRLRSEDDLCRLRPPDRTALEVGPTGRARPIHLASGRFSERKSRGQHEPHPNASVPRGATPGWSGRLP